jgi:hypothetical protein
MTSDGFDVIQFIFTRGTSCTYKVFPNTPVSQVHIFGGLVTFQGWCDVQVSGVLLFRGAGGCSVERGVVQGSGALLRGVGRCSGERGDVQGSGALFRGAGHCSAEQGVVQGSGALFRGAG